MMRIHWPLITASILAASLATAERATAAVSLYVNVPSVTGADPAPGYPSAMSVSSLTITPGTLAIEKTIDAASPQLFLAVANGVPLGTIEALVYDSPPVAAPTATLPFADALAASYQVNGTDEDVVFNADNPLSLYLEVPGIPGASSTPGHPNVMQISSFELTANDFTIVKLQDSASDELFLATFQGALLATARLLLYDDAVPGNEPDAVVEFSDLLISSSQVLDQRVEQHTFSFDSGAVPEPSSALLAVVTLASTAVMRRGVRSQRGAPFSPRSVTGG